MKYAICLALCLILAAVPASAAGTDVLDEQRQSLEVDELERAAQEELDGMDLTLDGDWQDNLAQLLDTGTEELGGVVVGCAFLIELEGLKGRDALAGYEVFTLMSYE